MTVRGTGAALPLLVGLVPLVLVLGCGASDDDSMAASCVPGTTMACLCPGNVPSAMTCLPTGGYGTCQCNATGSGGSLAGGTGGLMAGGTGGAASGGTGTAGSGAGGAPGTGGMIASSGSGGISGTGGAPVMSGSGGVMAGTGGISAGTGGVAAGTGGTSAGTGGAGGNADDEFDSVRQFCVDYINMYRATMSLPALARETHDKEMCSDMGAMQDAVANAPHGSAGMCFMGGGYYGAGQNTCPSLPVGGFGSATLMDALKRCLDQMWGEGPPPDGTTVQQCIDDHAGCFQMHGHWINMTQTMYKSVSCGFYMKADGSYWGNQDYPIKF